MENSDKTQISVSKWFEENKMIGVVRVSSAEDAEDMIKAAISGGFKIIQISIQTPQVFRLLETYSKMEGVLVGAGVITDAETALRAIKAGAKFIAGHYVDRQVISVAKNHDVFVIQGALTPTEAINAYQSGADLVKIFPAFSVGGPSYFKSLRRAFPFLKVVAAGGITLENVMDYLRHSVSVSIGESIFDKSLIRAHNWPEIEERARQFSQKLESLKVSR